MLKLRVKRHAVTQPLDESYRLIPLTQGQNAIVDASDFLWLSRWNWYATWSKNTRSFYATRKEGPRGKQRGVFMHRQILSCKSDEEEGDHRNHDTLDNRRRNLRKCTHLQNMFHRRTDRGMSGYIGVYWNRQISKWYAQIGGVHLGMFDSAEVAARARDAAAKIHHGQFAVLNFE